MRQGQQHALRMDEAAERVEILLHVRRIDDELVDQAGKARQRKIECDGRIGREDALDGRMGDIALVP